MAHLFIIIDENFTEYSSNVTLLCTNYRNKYILTVSSKKIIENMLFLYRINLTPLLIKLPYLLFMNYLQTIYFLRFLESDTLLLCCIIVLFSPKPR